MEVEISTSPPEFFDSSCTSTPYVSAPSSPPRRLGDFTYFSAPTSPTRATAAYAELRRLSLSLHDGAGAGPFLNLASPEVVDCKDTGGGGGGCDVDDDNFDFAFDFSGQLNMPEPTAAEELFDEGRIRTATPRPRPASPRRAAHEEALSSRWARKPAYNPFSAVAGDNTGGSKDSAVAVRGRSSSRRSTRFLSPNRIADFLWEESVQAAAAATKIPGTSKADVQTPPSPPPPAKTRGRKWWFKDLLLFRSASEGRAVRGKDPLRKYTLLAKLGKDDSKESSLRSAEGSASGRGGGGKDVRPVYRAAGGEERRRKTFLPYREGLLGCLGFNPSVHGLAKGLHSITQT